MQQGGALSIVKDGWKYIAPGSGPRLLALTNIESGNSPAPQLYSLQQDLGEQNNLAAKYPEKVKELAQLLATLKEAK